MAVTIVEEARPITGGVDTHADTHVAAALDSVGGLLGVREFPATASGYASLLGWLGGFGTVCLIGIEGTGSYGAGLSRHVTAAGVRVVEGRPLRSAGPPPPGQVRPARCRQRCPRRPVGPGPRRVQGP
jgi:transposase